MVHVFYNRRGSGKTKDLIKLANEKIEVCKGDVVYLDDDERPILELDRKIRFVSTNDFQLEDYNSFYGFLCGMISEDYDICTVCVDGLSNIVKGDIEEASHLFFKIENLAHRFNIEFYININSEKEEIPDFMKKYVA
jgi:hypothetical protein